jgi:glycosyl transferase, family 25
MQKIPVFVISLTRSKKRRDAIKAHLEHLAIAFTLVDAVDWQILESDYIETLTETLDIYPGDIGCYLSHIKTYELIVKSKVPVALVIEDDVTLSQEVKFLLNNGCESLDFDYCFLSSRDCNSEGKVFYDRDSGVFLYNKLQAYLLSAGPFSACAYLITLPAVQKRLEFAFPIKGAIDHYEYLPYKPRFRRIIPCISWLNKNSLSCEIRSGIIYKSRFPLFSRYRWFYPLKDLIYFRAFQKHLFKQRLIREGKLRRGIRWGSLPTFRKLVKMEM